MKQLAIIGAGGHGKVIADIAKLNGYTNIVFLDDNKTSADSCYPIIGTSNEANVISADLIVGIGDSVVRKKIQDQISDSKLISLVHPNAVVAEDVTIGKGTVVMAGVVINSGVTIGKGCIINTSSSIDHDCNIGDFVHVAVGCHVCGTVNVGSQTWLGAGAVVSNNINICSDCIVGVGAAVVKSITEKGVYLGVPAKRKK